MKIALILGKYSIGDRPLDFNDIWNNTRGLTGSELILIMYSLELVKLNHDISIYSIYSGQKLNNWNNIKLYDLNELNEQSSLQYDCVISINEPDELRNVSNKILRISSHQLNGFSYCKDKFEDFVDIFLSPSQTHLEFHKPWVKHQNNWIVLPDGCNPDWYTYDNKIEGRVVYISSADRGFHLLLQEWSKIKQAVPNASLKVFYNFNFGNMENIEPNNLSFKHYSRELAQRIRYIKENLPKVKHLNVEFVGSVSRTQIAEELSKAKCLAFPCSTVAFTEGFSISTLEACAAKALPIISGQDALEQIYKNHLPVVKAPIEKNINEFTNLVIKTLKDKEFYKEKTDIAYEFSKSLTWTKLVKQLEEIIIKGINERSR